MKQLSSETSQTQVTLCPAWTSNTAVQSTAFVSSFSGHLWGNFFWVLVSLSDRCLCMLVKGIFLGTHLGPKGSEYYSYPRLGVLFTRPRGTGDQATDTISSALSSLHMYIFIPSLLEWSPFTCSRIYANVICKYIYTAVLQLWGHTPGISAKFLDLPFKGKAALT